MYITFWGAAREVTGSCNLVEAGGLKILVDCGMFQGNLENERKNFAPLPFNPAEINAVVVTHAHLDHIGRLPLLVRGGFSGYFYATPATVALTELILADALQVMIDNNRKMNTPILFDQAEISQVMSQFRALDYQMPLFLKSDQSQTVKISLADAGHIFGSAFVIIEAEDKKCVFSGDIGNINVPILRETENLPDHTDVLVCESTYGDRLHETRLERQEIIRRLVLESATRGGTLMIPAFSLERTQELIYDLNDLIDRKHQLPRLPIFLDSPLAINATKIYRLHAAYYDAEAKKLFEQDDDLFTFPGLMVCATKEESMRINQIPAPKIIIAGSGMMTGGRILHHAKRYLSDINSTLLIVGYQAAGTLGRKILEGESPVIIYGEQIPVRCRVEAVGALSAHGDQNKLLNWIGRDGNMPHQVYLNHGEASASTGLATRLFDDLKIKTTVVDFGLRVEV